MFLNKIKPFLYLGGFSILLSFLLRIVLINHPITTSSFSFFEIVKILFIGFVNDGFVFILASFLLAIYFLFLSNSKYKKPYGQVIFGLLVLFLAYTLWFPNNIFEQYGGGLQKVAAIFIGLKTFLFGLMLFLPTQRVKIRNILYFITLLLYVLAITFNTVSEYFFWNEFGVRYNFIAVDYLIYTTEVIGNIMESYPVVPLFGAILLVSVAVTWWLYKKTKDALLELPNFGQKIGLLVSFIVLAGISLFAIPKLSAITSSNTFANELEANGLPKFYDAFTHNQLDFTCCAFSIN